MPQKNINYAVIIGSEEIKSQNVVVKDLIKNEQVTITLNEFKDYFTK